MSTTDFITRITSEAIFLSILLSLPAIVVSLLIGVGIALFSAVTQIQEQTLSFAPKMILVYAVLAATSGWSGNLIVQFTVRCFEQISHMILR